MAIAVDANLGSNTLIASATSITLTTAAAVASNGFITMRVGWYGAFALSSVSGGSLTWTIDKQDNNTGDTAVRSAIISAQVPAGLTISAALTASWGANSVAGRSIHARSFTGVASPTVITGTPSRGQPASGTAWNCGSITTTDANALLFAAAMGDGVDTTGACTAPLLVSDAVNTAGGGDSYVSGYQILSATGTYSPAGTWPSSQVSNIGVAVAYKAAAGGTAFTKTLTATAGSTATLSRQANAIRSASSTAVATIPKSIATTKSATSAGSAVVVKQARKTLAVSSAGVATLATLRIRLMELAAPAGSSATVSRQVAVIRAVASVSAVTVSRAVAKTLAVTSAGAATLATLKAKFLTLSATSTAVATVANLRARFLTLAATSVASVVLARDVRKTLSATSVASVTLTAPQPGAVAPAGQRPTTGVG